MAGMTRYFSHWREGSRGVSY